LERRWRTVGTPRKPSTHIDAHLSFARRSPARSSTSAWHASTSESIVKQQSTVRGAIALLRWSRLLGETQTGGHIADRFQSSLRLACTRTPAPKAPSSRVHCGAPSDARWSHWCVALLYREDSLRLPQTGIRPMLTCTGSATAR
jgi:hypothetical protein